jgi:tetratricopeptide (TPR) repeat protein
MKKYLLSAALAVALSSASLAQRTPQPSSAAGVMQTVGVTDFTVKYSRPAIKGRQVFADSSALAPYNQIWRTGANMATTLEASSDFSFGGKPVPAGKYALFSIPSGSAWTVILNKNFNQGGTDNYKESEDAARVTVVPTSADFKESFSIDFSNLSDSTANLNISWGSVQVPVRISVPTETLTMAGLNKTLAEKPEDVAALQSTAGYLLNRGKDLPQALSMADKAIGLKETFSNLWLKAQILNKMGKVAEALPVAQKALTVGAASGDGAFASFYKGQIEKGIAGMTAKLPAVKEAANAVKGKKKKK